MPKITAIAANIGNAVLLHVRHNARRVARSLRSLLLMLGSAIAAKLNCVIWRSNHTFRSLAHIRPDP
jgi:hypothetical protein